MNEHNFYYLLFSNLVAMCPRDTGNMVRNIILEDYGEFYLITVGGPRETKKKGFYDYAQAVNYGLAAKAQGRPRSVKEERNFMWIERTIKQTIASMGLFESEVEYELY